MTLIPDSIARLATSQSTWSKILKFHSEIATDDYVKSQHTFYEESLLLYGDSFYYFDIVNVIYTLGVILRPSNYLEIGVRRGRSCCVLARAFPQVNIHAFDMWIHGYAGMENPGPEYVREQLFKNGFSGEITFVDGDSHLTIPKYLNENPDLIFDMVTIDGDHSESGARADIRDTIDRIRVGGAIIFDDLCHPKHPWMKKVWLEEVASRDDFRTFEYADFGFGVAFGIRAPG